LVKAECVIATGIGIDDRAERVRFVDKGNGEREG
jgi:hypothetical protein